MPPKKKPTALVPADGSLIEPRIHFIRGERVMLDAELAELYGVPTRALNQAVERNPERFPDDFAFHLTPSEVANLKSQVVTSSSGYGGRRKPPRAFTEHGVAMLSSVLRSDTAVRVNIEIMRAFTRLRRLFATPGELVAQIQRLAETAQVHDAQIKAVTDALRKMIEPPPEDAPKRRFGFHPPDPSSELTHPEAGS
jgi:hypothetical protein